MPSDISKFTVRADSELLQKFRFVAEYEARSANKQFAVLMRKYVAEFEKTNGEIKLNEDLQ